MSLSAQRIKHPELPSQDDNFRSCKHFKLRRFAITCLAGMLLQSSQPSQTVSNQSKFKRHYAPIKNVATLDISLDQSLQQFQRALVSRVSEQERNILAQMLYGEAGHGADAFEILHTVLNRASSPLFPNSITAIVTTKGQYVGYRPQNPVTKKYRRIVDIVIEDWESNNCKKIEGCNHYYFVTGIRSICNKFEISPDEQGTWVPTPNKKYAKLRHYCDIATEQSKRYFSEKQR